jgi:nicotinamidase/pyrazinamidase
MRTGSRFARKRFRQDSRAARARKGPARFCGGKTPPLILKAPKTNGFTESALCARLALRLIEVKTRQLRVFSMMNRRGFLGAGAALAGVAGLGARALAADPVKPGAKSVLVVVDVQNCFLPGGSLAVKDGEQIIPVINKLAKGFENVIVTQDWHTPGHISFASAHPGKKPFDVVKLPYGDQVLWPDHCVQGTEGAALAKDLDVSKAQLVIRKGFHPNVDSYSAVMEADKTTRTGLAGYLKERGMDTLFVTGLATDFCVAWTAIDAATAGFKVYVVEDACRGIDANGSLLKSWDAMQKAGVTRIQSSGVAL